MLSHYSILGYAAVYSGMWHVLSILSAYVLSCATQPAVKCVYIYGFGGAVTICHCTQRRMVQLVVCNSLGRNRQSTSGRTV